MKIADASTIAAAALRGHDLPKWSVRFDRARQRIGACFYRQRVISLSRAFVENNEEAVVLDTIRHEVAHALAWEHDRETGHGAAWKRWCAVTGAVPRRCVDDEVVKLPPARYRCTVLEPSVSWTRGSGAQLQTGQSRIGLQKGAVFGRHRLTRRLRDAARVGLVSVFDTKTGRPVEG